MILDKYKNKIQNVKLHINCIKVLLPTVGIIFLLYSLFVSDIVDD